MSEPTSGGNQKPDPDQQPEPEQAPGDNQDQIAGSVFSDPTAPVWADPTAPIPASPAPEVPSRSAQDAPPTPPVPPAPPGSDYPPYGEQPSAAPQPPPPPAPPVSNPYAQQPPTDPYGQPAGQYGQPQPGQQYPPYGQSPYATGASAPSNTSAIVLTIVSGVSMLGTAFFVGIPSLVFGIMALTSNNTDPVGSRKKSKVGWIIYAINAAVVVLVVVFGVVALVVFSRDGTFNSDTGF